MNGRMPKFSVLNTKSSLFTETFRRPKAWATVNIFVLETRPCNSPTLKRLPQEVRSKNAVSVPPKGSPPSRTFFASDSRSPTPPYIATYAFKSFSPKTYMAVRKPSGRFSRRSTSRRPFRLILVTTRNIKRPLNKVDFMWF